MVTSHSDVRRFATNASAFTTSWSELIGVPTTRDEYGLTDVSTTLEMEEWVNTGFYDKTYIDVQLGFVGGRIDQLIQQHIDDVALMTTRIDNLEKLVNSFLSTANQTLQSARLRDIVKVG